MSLTNESSFTILSNPLAVRLQTEVLQSAWERVLLNIEQSRTESAILEQVSTARGFAWGLRVAELVDEVGYTTMGAEITLAQQAALHRAGSRQ
ncbi:hypothetical protein [Pseudomonas sp. C2B4]|uniref:hypothetical protein n=1 Tax=Pseudomonas sp. C2B4 TaxID=2735270 RepID=UPI001585E76C|nr:hypothetical protein [Pseudomonas sp. C2B4]NUU37836.1 hypothetical protein [Pseudomonas sp. C2B4]